MLINKLINKVFFYSIIHVGRVASNAKVRIVLEIKRLLVLLSNKKVCVVLFLVRIENCL
jgi:hypothetical protein